MKKYLTVIIITLAMTCFSFATTGGPDFITSAYYNSKNDSIWYIKQYYDGRGGIKIIQYSIKDHKTQIITNIEGIKYDESMMNGTTETSNEEIETILKKMGLKKLIPVHIDIMPLYFTLTTSRYEIYTDTGTILLHKGDFSRLGKSVSLYRMVWKNKVYVNNRLQNVTTITTCGLDPINYRGLSLPGTNFVAIIVSSEKRDCDESGYIGEEIFVVRYIRMYKKYFTGLHSDLYRKVFEDNQSQGGHYGDDRSYYETHDYFGESGPFKPSIGGLYTNELKNNKENIIKKR